MHNRVPARDLPQGWAYENVPDTGYDPYMKWDYPTTKEILVCNTCK
jgi:hypothetical protein